MLPDFRSILFGAFLFYTNMKEEKITEDDLDAVWQGYKYYMVQILNKEYDLDEAISDLRGLIGSKYDQRIAKFD